MSVQCEILEVTYGRNNRVTVYRKGDADIKMFGLPIITANKVFIPFQSYNDLTNGDPEPYVKKSITIKYTINGKLLEESYEEGYQDPIYIPRPSKRFSWTNVRIDEYNVIKQEYLRNKSKPSDINEHLETLAKYSSKCQHITELGVRGVVSTWAFAIGLLCNGNSQKRLMGVDIEDDKMNHVYIQNAMKDNRIDYTFIKDNDLNIEIEQTDLLFIDTWHVYGQLKRELEKHHGHVNKYIIMHDTTVDEFVGESIRCGLDYLSQSRSTGWNISEVVCGLYPAIVEFLDKHPEWRLVERFTNNNGLTILERIN